VKARGIILQACAGVLVLMCVGLSGCDSLFTVPGIEANGNSSSTTNAPAYQPIPSNNQSGSTATSYSSDGSSDPSAATSSGNALASSSPTRDILKYKFAGKSYENYSMEIKLQGETQRSIIGSTGFSAKAATNATIETPVTQGSGTAWVLSKDGYLMTCAHVVDGANQITVTINNQTYNASLIAADGRFDLAILKIPATNLTPLPLAEDGICEQGQEVRSVGFPLSSVLGESIKINRGTIAGFVDIEGRQLIQIDVPINPGNSGGPVVDLYGNVIGVASEKLAGSDISSVGFCVPAAVVRQWGGNFVRATPVGKKGWEMSGTDLSKKVSPSVALVKASSGGSRRDLKAFVIEGNGGYTVLGDGYPTSDVRDEGSLLVDDSGTLIDLKDCHQLPFLLGPLASFAIPPLSPDGQPQWRTEELIQVAATSQEESRQDPLEAMLSRRFSYGYGGRQTQRVVTLVSAARIQDFQIVSSDSNDVKIEKRWEIVSEPVPGIGFSIGCTGTGTWTFNRSLGLMSDFQGTANYTLSNENGQISLPMTIKVTRNTEELAKLANEIEKRAAAMPSAPTLGSPDIGGIPSLGSALSGLGVNSNITDPELQAAVNGLKGTGDKATRLEALEELSKISINSTNRAAVVEALAANLLNKDAEVKAKILDVLSEWDNASMVSHVIDMLEDSDASVVEAAIRYLGVSSDAEAADELAAVAKDKEQFRAAAMKALTEIGPAAEKQVIELLKNKNTDLRKAACKVLGKIGGDESVALLRKLAASDTAASTDAKAALAELGVSE
jgi:S1-C subfamily serine protease